MMMRLGVHTISRNTEITPEDVRQIQSIGTAPQAALLGVEPLGDGFDLVRVLDRIRYYYIQEAGKKSKDNSSEIARMLGFKNRTPLNKLVENNVNGADKFHPLTRRKMSNLLPVLREKMPVCEQPSNHQYIVKKGI